MVHYLGPHAYRNLEFRQQEYHIDPGECFGAAEAILQGIKNIEDVKSLSP